MNVEGVNVERTEPKVVVASLRARKLSVAGSASEQIARLAKHINTNTPREKIAEDCAKCGGACSMDDDNCPFCGDGEIDIDDTTTAIVPGSAGTIAPSREQELDEVVKRVRALKSRAVECYWELGTEVKRIHDQSLWKERTDERGAPKYKTWGQFAEIELGFGPQYVFRLMDVAKTFSAADIAAIGRSKLGIVLKVPIALQKQLLAKAVEGATARELEAAAKPMIAGEKKRDTGRGQKTGGAAKHKPTAKKGGRLPEKITVASLVKRIEVPLMKGTGKKPARALSDVPTGEEVLMNGVLQTYLVTKNEAGNLILVVERRRAAK